MQIYAKTFGGFRDNSYLCSANTTEADAKADADEWELHYRKGVYVTLCSLTLRSLANSRIQVKNKATMDAHWVCNDDSPYCVCESTIGCIHISVWASALLVSTWMGNARRLKRGTSNMYSNPHFLYLVQKT